MKSNYKFLISLVISISLGLLITWIDSRPNWDDTGITAVAIFSVSAFFGFIMRNHPWVWALTVGLWIPLYNVLFFKNYTAILALIIAFIGSYAGSLIHKLFLKEV
ncbi:MAG: hypothetical protein NTZ27_02870 [Ignavibacteriales bacterium]|nr:hypothetical protein [Ignavibacteriales bacterium]